MNKKISAVLISALMVLTMFTALVPSASAAKEVAAPYEFIGVVNTTTPTDFFNLAATSAGNPSLLFYDLDDEIGQEELTAISGSGADAELTIGEGNLTYSTTNWEDPETPGDYYVAWLGAKYFVITNTSTWRISEKLFDEDDNDDHLLRVGESLSLADGWGITALEIDVDGGEAWISLTQDGEEVDNEVVTEGFFFIYEEDLGASDDTVVINFTVETVFAGMNTNLVKVSNIDLISTEVVEIKNGDDDVIDGYTIATTTGTLSMDNDDDVSLAGDDVTDILGGRFGIRVNEPETMAAVVRTITEPGTYELIGIVNATPTGDEFFNLTATSAGNPALLFYDLDDEIGQEELIAISGSGADAPLTIGKGNLTYSTSDWEDPDTPGDYYVAWLGAKYFVVTNTSTWRISEKLFDEDDNDDHLLRVGESLSLADGWGITALEIDVDGGEAWISLTQDGEEIDNEVVTEGLFFVYEEDLGASDDTVVINFTVETVFAGMNTNLVKVSNIDLISTEVVEIKNGDDDVIDGYTIATTTGTLSMDNDDDVSLAGDDVTDILGGRFGIRVNEPETMAAIVQEVIVGGGVTTTATATPVSPTATATEVGTNGEDGTEDGTAAPTEGPTAEPTEEPIPEPTPEPGFEAVFAVAGLLAVAYLVLRQRD